MDIIESQFCRYFNSVIKSNQSDGECIFHHAAQANKCVFSQTRLYFQRIYRVQNDGCSQCQINSIMPGDLAWLCVAKLLRWQVAAACRDEDSQSWHTPQGCSAAPRRARTNPAVYRYTSYRLNTRPGEGMTECVSLDVRAQRTRIA